MLVTLDGQWIDYGKLLPYVDEHLFWVTAFVIPFHRWGRDSMNIIIFIECLWSIELSACGTINIETLKKKILELLEISIQHLRLSRSQREYFSGNAGEIV